MVFKSVGDSSTGIRDSPDMVDLRCIMGGAEGLIFCDKSRNASTLHSIFRKTLDTDEASDHANVRGKSRGTFLILLPLS